jgi:hypothetical protein
LTGWFKIQKCVLDADFLLVRRTFFNFLIKRLLFLRPNYLLLSMGIQAQQIFRWNAGMGVAQLNL